MIDGLDHHAQLAAEFCLPHSLELVDISLRRSNCLDHYHGNDQLSGNKDGRDECGGEFEDRVNEGIN